MIPVFRLEEAIAYARRRGLDVNKKKVASVIWPDATENTQQVNMTRLCAGRTIRVDISWIPLICGMLHVSADYLFGLSEQ